MRILCLHGWRTSGAILRDQMLEVSQALEAGIGPALDLHFVDAPHAASGPAQDVVAANWPGVPYFEWWDKTEDGAYAGADETLAYLREYDQRNGPFEGVVGFSQGAALASLLCSGSGAPSPTLPELRFAVIMSGFCPADKTIKAAMAAAEPLRVPAVVTHGKKDFNKKGSELLAAMWAPGLATLVEHGAGHVVPLS